MQEPQIYLIVALILCYIIYRVFKFMKRKVRWLIASIPMFVTMGGVNLPHGKLQHLIALFT